MAEDDFLPTPEEMATLNGVAISPDLMHTILTRFMALPEDKRVESEPQLAGMSTVCNAVDVPGDKELLALAVHIRLSALNDLIEQGVLREWMLMRDGGACMDLILSVVRAVATETVILNGGGDLAFDADRFRQRVAANATLQATTNAPPKRAPGAGTRIAPAPASQAGTPQSGAIVSVRARHPDSAARLR